MGKVCSHCGAPVGRKSLACRECGSDVETGWSPSVGTESFGTASFDDLEYERFLDSEGLGSAVKRRWRRMAGWASVVLVLLLVLLIAFM